MNLPLSSNQEMTKLSTTFYIFWLWSAIDMYQWYNIKIIHHHTNVTKQEFTNKTSFETFDMNLSYVRSRRTNMCDQIGKVVLGDNNSNSDFCFWYEIRFFTNFDKIKSNFDQPKIDRTSWVWKRSRLLKFF